MDKKMAFEYYKLLMNRQVSWMNLHSQRSRQYLTIISAVTTVLAILLGVLYKDNFHPMFPCTVVTLPLINILICLIAIRACNRAYLRFLEDIIVMAKIEPIIGLYEQRKNIQKDSTIYPFPEDKYFLVDRWITSRKQKSSIDFINENINLGANKYVQLSFKFLILVNVLITMGIIIVILFKNLY